MIILGIDPGTLVLGYGVIERVGSTVRRLGSGVVTPAPGELSTRLVTLFAVLEEVVARHRPDAVAIEDLFHSRNAKSALVLGHARGVALLVAGRAGLPVFAYAPALVKKSVVGHGRAEKFQVQKMVRAILGLATEPVTDEADALAVALCHSQRTMLPLAVVATVLPVRIGPVAPPLAGSPGTPPAGRTDSARPAPPRRRVTSASPLPANAVLPASQLAAALAKKQPRSRRGAR